MKRSLLLVPALLAVAACTASRDAPAAAGPEATVTRTSPMTSAEDGPVLRDSYALCIEQSGGVTPAMQDCIAEESDYQEARLKSAYDALVAEGASLETDQANWLATRDEACAWDAEEEGQGQRLEANECQLTMTAERARELEERLTGN